MINKNKQEVTSRINKRLTEFKCVNPVQLLQGDSLLLTTKSLGIPGTLLIDLTMKPSSDLELANPGMVMVNTYFIIPPF